MSSLDITPDINEPAGEARSARPESEINYWGAAPERKRRVRAASDPVDNSWPRAVDRRVAAGGEFTYSSSREWDYDQPESAPERRSRATGEGRGATSSWRRAADDDSLGTAEIPSALRRRVHDDWDGADPRTTTARAPQDQLDAEIRRERRAARAARAESERAEAAPAATESPRGSRAPAAPAARSTRNRVRVAPDPTVNAPQRLDEPFSDEAAPRGDRIPEMDVRALPATPAAAHVQASTPRYFTADVREARIAELRNRMADATKRREALCAKLGASLYEATRDNPILRMGREELYDGIAQCDAERQAFQRRIDEISVEEQAQRIAQQGYECPRCHFKMNAEDRFCGGCGLPIADVIAGQAGLASPGNHAVPRCPTCGGAVSEGDAFCMHCGSSLN